MYTLGIGLHHASMCYVPTSCSYQSPISLQVTLHSLLAIHIEPPLVLRDLLRECQLQIERIMASHIPDMKTENSENYPQKND
ncbi:unnamed protein product [Oppiella nova]|uniref:Uncharacterized protein n=1 Tax=Oppiella nova TaxID=334625 RepID=A0A7R9LEU9_9ACAR|nr:unnamed protein product [Oppiella nova]CAG2162942.1 unnamed protein product [Oppiella nova]